MRLLFFILSFFMITSLANAIEVGEEAPDFTLESLDHGTQKLSDYKGKIVYLFFLGYGCPPCISDSPYIQSEIYDKYDHEDVQVLGLDVWDGDISGLASFKASVQGGIDFPLLNNAGSVQSLYGIPNQHYTVIVDQDGIVAQVHDNYHNGLNLDESRNIIDQLLSVSSIDEDNHLAHKFELKHNYPNPFNPQTNIPFTIDKTQNITLDVFDISGKLIKSIINAPFAAGTYTAIWNARDNRNRSVSSGVYFVKLSGESLTQTRQIILIK